MDDLEAAKSAAIVRTGLESRAQWRTKGTCPFGLAWRSDASEAIQTWGFSPPYLPVGKTIDVAIDGDDPHQPMMFSFPGSMPPQAWDLAKRGDLQRPSGYSHVSNITLTLPFDIQPSPALIHLSEACSPQLSLDQGHRYALSLVLSGRADNVTLTLGS
jgi:hypothetical protein